MAATFAQVGEQFGFTEAEVRDLQDVMHRVWGGIAYDCEAFMEDPYNKNDIVELIVDAGRMRDFAYDEDETDLVSRFYNSLHDHDASWREVSLAIYEASNWAGR